VKNLFPFVLSPITYPQITQIAQIPRAAKHVDSQIGVICVICG